MLPSGPPADDLAPVTSPSPLEPAPVAPTPAAPHRVAWAPHRALRVGVLAVATTLGAVVGFGVRAGGAGRVLSAAGLALRGLPAVVSPDRGLGATALLGALHHVVLVLAWSAAFTALAGRWRGARLVLAAAAFAAVSWALDARWLPAPLRLAAGTLDRPQRVVAFVLLAAALAVGTRFALPRAETALAGPRRSSSRAS